MRTVIFPSCSVYRSTGLPSTVPAGCFETLPWDCAVIASSIRKKNTDFIKSPIAQYNYPVIWRRQYSLTENSCYGGVLKGHGFRRAAKCRFFFITRALARETHAMPV